MTKFRELNIGDTFDFVDDRPERRIYNSFFDRCTKTGPRSYSWTNQHGTLTSRVGTTNIEVYHVERGES